MVALAMVSCTSNKVSDRNQSYNQDAQNARTYESSSDRDSTRLRSERTLTDDEREDQPARGSAESTDGQYRTTTTESEKEQDKERLRQVEATQKEADERAKVANRAAKEAKKAERAEKAQEEAREKVEDNR